MAINKIWKKPSQVYYGWWMVAACFLFLGLGSSLASGPALSVIFLPVSQELGISRAALSLVFSLASAEGALEGPLVGWLIDRFGPRLLMMAGTAIAAVGYLLLSQVHSYWAFVLVYLAVVSVGTGAGQWAPVLAAMNIWFRRHRALTMSVVAGSQGMGALLIPLYAGVVLAYGWRSGVAMVGLVLLVVTLPLSLAVRRSPESMGLRPDGDAPPSNGRIGEPSVARRAAPAPPGEGSDFTVREAVRTLTFWMMTLVMGLRFFGRTAMTLHFIPILVWKGMGPQQAAYVMGVMLFWTLPSRPLVGWLADRFSKRLLLAFGLGLWTLSPLLLIFGEGSWVPWVAAVIFGLAEGFPPVHHALFGDYFGRRNFATLRGLMQSLQTPFPMVAPFLAGLIYDRSQSYELILFLAAGLWIVGAVVYLLVPNPRRSQA